MKNLKIHIISRVIFPVQSPRSFRTTELANELARQGHDVTVFAVLGNYDYSYYEKETGVKVKNTGKMLFATKNSDGKARYNFFDKLLFHAFHIIFEFPDIEFLFRVPQIISKNKKADVLITIAVPHPIHWGATLAKKINPQSFPQKWISDCGDPYMLSSFSGSKRKYLYHLRFLEKWWCRNTDYITIPIEEGKKGYYPEFHHKIKIIPQGFNFSNTVLATYSKNSIPTFIYSGVFHRELRNPYKFLDFLISQEFDFKFIIYTKSGGLKDYKRELKHKLEVRDYIPREKLIYELSKADFLINITNPDKVHSPSKLIDYALTKRPVLDISTNFNEHEIFFEFIRGEYSKQTKIDNIEDYNIKNVTQKFMDLL